jgi:hypothetical protein
MELNLGRVKHIREPKSSSDVYIGRGSKWGNPFKIGVHGNREEVIAKYEEYLMNSNELLSSLNESTRIWFVIATLSLVMEMCC